MASFAVMIVSLSLPCVLQNIALMTLFLIVSVLLIDTTCALKLSDLFQTTQRVLGLVVIDPCGHQRRRLVAG